MNYTDGIIKNSEFFTTTELADKLKMNVQVITRKVQAGEIMAYKVGKEWRIPERSVFEWLESNVNKYATPDKKQKAVRKNSGNSNGIDLPTGRNRRKHLLEYILAQFEPRRKYSEDEIDGVIRRYYDDDTDAVRREFVTEKMMECIDGNYRRRAGYRFSD